MTQSKAANKTARTHEDDPRDPEDDFERPDAETAAEGGAPYEHPAPSGADRRAPQNDAEHGFSQDSGYATSGGPSKGAAQRPKRG
jgi:hypothetical protein